jgi:hypothetical protein
MDRENFNLMLNGKGGINSMAIVEMTTLRQVRGEDFSFAFVNFSGCGLY